MKVMLEVECDPSAAFILANPDGSPVTWVVVDAKRELGLHEYHGEGYTASYAHDVRCELRLVAHVPYPITTPDDALIEVGRAVARAGEESP